MRNPISHPGRFGRWMVALLGLVALATTPPIVVAEQAVHLRLIDRLDRPQDGYCLDILGVGSRLRVDVPLFAHNCKLGLTNDSAVVLEARGTIRFPAVDLCLTAAGVAGKALPGAAILLRRCGESIPFFDAPALQQFRLASDGRVELEGSGLCLAVGDTSAHTYSQHDRWRVLFTGACDEVPASRSRWEAIVP